MELDLSRRPDCAYCPRKESALTFLAGKPICGDCVIEFEKKKNKITEQIMRGE